MCGFPLHLIGLARTLYLMNYGINLCGYPYELVSLQHTCDYRLFKMTRNINVDMFINDRNRSDIHISWQLRNTNKHLATEGGMWKNTNWFNFFIFHLHRYTYILKCTGFQSVVLSMKQWFHPKNCITPWKK